MKSKLFGLCFFAINSCFALTWEEAFDAYEVGGTILERQYRSYASGSALPLADPKIKEIPIHENGEELVDLRECGYSRIRMLPDPRAPFASPSCNSGLPSASKMRLAVFLKLQGMIEALDALAPRFGYEPGQVDIHLFEGLRDLKTQSELFQKKVEEILLARPELSLEAAEQEAAKWVSPVKNNVPVHSTGAAVDIRLWDNQKQDFVDMGAFGVIWGPNKTSPTFSEDLLDAQKLNRLYCLMAAERAGLTNYPYEFWHFSSGDRVDAYWKGESQAVYGSVHLSSDFKRTL